MKNKFEKSLNHRNVWKKWLAVAVAFALIVGNICLSEPEQAKAAFADAEVESIFTAKSGLVDVSPVQLSDGEKYYKVVFTDVVAVSAGAIGCEVINIEKCDSETNLDFSAYVPETDTDGSYLFNGTVSKQYTFELKKSENETIYIWLACIKTDLESFFMNSAADRDDFDETRCNDNAILLKNDEIDGFLFEIVAYSEAGFNDGESCYTKAKNGGAASAPTPIRNGSDSLNVLIGAIIYDEEHPLSEELESGDWITYTYTVKDKLGRTETDSYTILYMKDPEWGNTVVEYPFENNTAPTLTIPFEFNNRTVSDSDPVKMIITGSHGGYDVTSGAAFNYASDSITIASAAITSEMAEDFLTSDYPVNASIKAAFNMPGEFVTAASGAGITVGPEYFERPIELDVSRKWVLTGYDSEGGVHNWVSTSLTDPMLFESEIRYFYPEDEIEEENARIIGEIYDSMDTNTSNENWASDVVSVLGLDGVCSLYIGLSSSEDTYVPTSINNAGIYYLFVRLAGSDRLATAWKFFDRVYVENPVYVDVLEVDDRTVFSFLVSDPENEENNILYSQTGMRYNIDDYIYSSHQVIKVNNASWNAETDYITVTGNMDLNVVVKSNDTGREYERLLKVVIDDTKPDNTSIQYVPVSGQENNSIIVKGSMDEGGTIFTNVFFEAEARAFAGIGSSVTGNEADEAIITSFENALFADIFHEETDGDCDWDEVDAGETAELLLTGLNNAGKVFIVTVFSDYAENSVIRVLKKVYSNGGDGGYSGGGSNTPAPKQEEDLNKTTKETLEAVEKSFEGVKTAGSENAAAEAKPAEKASDGSYTVDGKTASNQFVTDGDNLIFTDEAGKPVSDTLIVNGEDLYFAKEDGTVAKNEVVNVGDDEKSLMIAKEDGTLITEEDQLVKLGKKLYLTGESGKVCKSGFSTVKNGKTEKTYYSNAKGVVKTGLFKAGNGKHYIAGRKGVIKVNRLVTVTEDGEKTLYKTNKKGKIVKNKDFEVDGVKYHADGSGHVTVVE